jgi:MFS family permease
MSSGTTEPAPAAAAGQNVGTLPYAKAPPRTPLFSADAWAPLKVELFRSLYIATSIAQIGTWVREAGGPGLMKILTEGQHDQPTMVGKVLVYSNLPICLFSILAGALADVLDRRKLLLGTQIWMLLVSAILGLLTIGGHVSPFSLLAFTFLLGVGTAASGPALQALLPELVPRKDLPLAINLNSVALNVARALGPALLIIVIKAVPGRVGIGISFLLTAASFIWAIWILYSWKRPSQRAAVHGEEMWGAIRSGFLYNINSPANRAILIRVMAFIIPAVVMWSQVPIIAKQQLGYYNENAVETAYAMLFAFVGMGAVFGVLIMPGLHARFSIDPVVNVCTLFFACGLMLLSFVHHMWLAAFIMIFLGINWVIIPTNFNTATQKSVPLWVKGRAISFYLTVLFGSFAIGGAIWGRVTTHSHAGISTSLFVGGLSMAVLLVLAIWFPLTINEGLDLSAANVTGPDIYPGIDPNSGPAAGPIDVHIDYHVDPAKGGDFLKLMHDVGRQRRRNGAARWRLEPLPAGGQSALRYREVCQFHSSAELNRQPARMTRADVQLLGGIRPLLHGATEQPMRTAVVASPRKAAAFSGLAPQPLSIWLLSRLATSFERTIDEAEAAADRFAAMRRRERKGPGHVRISIEIPASDKIEALDHARRTNAFL